MAKDFKDLFVWQKSMDLVVEVYQLAKMLPKKEQYSLCDQIKRSAVSIPSNIAEGQGRKTNNEFNRFLSIANGSKAELETQLLLCVKINYLKKDEISLALNLIHDIGKMINGLQKSLR
ncbi:MAG: four helix bundle protein [Fibrobacter sp.]|nr:four helix bundle protein [Fibrobacter sp.]